MATFDYVVDTTPMADSVDRVNASVAVVGTAVTAMEAAVVKTEHDASEKICSNIDTGFYLLMRSQISQKLAANFSIVNSKLMSMSQIGKAIDAMHSQMENDFQMIKRRYIKLFHSLDKELDLRIRELDKPAMDIAQLRSSLITNRIRNDSASAFFYARDSQTVSQMALMARVKSKTGKSLAAITSDTYNSQTYSKTLAHMMKKNAVKENTQTFIPVLCAEESSMFADSSTLSHVFIPETVNTVAKTAIENTFAQNVPPEHAAEKSPEEKKEITNSFMKYIAASGVDQRTSDMMMKLYNGGTL